MSDAYTKTLLAVIAVLLVLLYLEQRKNRQNLALVAARTKEALDSVLAAVLKETAQPRSMTHTHVVQLLPARPEPEPERRAAGFTSPSLATS